MVYIWRSPKSSMCLWLGFEQMIDLGGFEQMYFEQMQGLL